MIKTLAHKRHAVGFYYLHVGVKIAVKYKICQAFYLETRDWCEFSARNNILRSTIGEKHRLGYIFINQLTNSSTLRPLR